MTKRKRCAANDCKGKTAPIIGWCKYCDLNFCGNHRLPEVHLCSNLKICKDVSHKKLTNDLSMGAIKGQKVEKI